MRAPPNERAAPALAGSGSSKSVRLGGEDRETYSERQRRRQALSRHLCEAGPRPTYEALIEIAAGADLDVVLERFGRVPVSTYHAVGASEFGGVQ